MKQIGKLSVIFINVLFASNALAAQYKGDAVPFERGLQGGAYIGAKLGYDSYVVHQNINFGAGLLTANPTLNSDGLALGLFTGYGGYFKNFYYLGGELIADYSDASITYGINDAVSGYNLRQTTAGGFGFSVMPGLKINNGSLFYLRLGASWSHFNVLETTSVANVSTSRWLGGFAYGFGLESLFYQNWSARVDYSRTQNTSFRTALAAGTNFNVADNRITLGVVYHIT